MRREDSEALRTVTVLSVDGRRGRRRPKKKWLNTRRIRELVVCGRSEV